MEKDPAHPLPYLHLALGLILFGKGPAPPPGVFEQAKAAALEALELDDELPEAHAALAHIKLVYDWDWAGAEQAYRRALELNPNITAADVWNGNAWFVVLTGSRDEALAAIRRNKELDPLTPLWAAWRAWLYWAVGEYDGAMEEVRTSLALDPDLPVGLYVLGCLYAEKGMYEQALAVHWRAAEVSPL